MVKNKSVTRPGLTPEHKAEKPVANVFCSLLVFCLMWPGSGSSERISEAEGCSK